MTIIIKSYEGHLKNDEEEAPSSEEIRHLRRFLAEQKRGVEAALAALEAGTPLRVTKAREKKRRAA